MNQSHMLHRCMSHCLLSSAHTAGFCRPCSLLCCHLMPQLAKGKMLHSGSFRKPPRQAMLQRYPSSNLTLHHQMTLFTMLKSRPGQPAKQTAAGKHMPQQLPGHLLMLPSPPQIVLWQVIHVHASACIAFHFFFVACHSINCCLTWCLTHPHHSLQLR